MYGLDFLGLGSKYWKVSESLRVFPKGWALGCFDSEFGDVSDNLKRFLASGKVSAVRVHLYWDKDHKKLCPMEVLEKRAPFYERLAKKYPAVKFYVSHTCEYKNTSRAEIKKRIDLIKRLAPSCIPVNSCLLGATIKGVLTETHDVKKAAKIISTDGIPSFDINVKTYLANNSNAELCFLWAPLFNLREDYDGPLVPPKERKAAPSLKYIRAIVALTKNAGKPEKPTFKGKIVAIKKPLLYKTFAEDKEGADIRANKPLFISPSKAKELLVVDYKGKAVARFKFYGTFEKLYRHYSGTGSNLYGYEIAEKALKQSGNPWCCLKDGSTYYGPFHPAFRKGYFRVEVKELKDGQWPDDESVF